MKKIIEIPDGYEARIEGNKVILELKESEDERIRRELIYFLNAEIPQCSIQEHANKLKEFVSWLEKQGEQKEQKSVQDKEEREYVRTLKSLIADFLRDKEDVNRGYYQDIYDWLDGRHIEQKPAEWSENDTVFLNEITDFFENKTVRLQHDLDMYAHWLKSLPERFSLQPKQEWSEKDEENFEWFDKFFRAESVIAGGKDIPQDKYFWFKSLRPQPKQEWSETDKLHLNNAILVAKKEWGVNSYTARWLEALRDNYKKCNSHWKPSEEQMEALKEAVYQLDGGEYSNGIDSLLSDLQKSLQL